MKNKNWVKYTIIYLVYALIICGLTYLITALISNNGIYPSGSDTMYHVYRGQYVYESICKADFFPLLNQYWYNEDNTLYSQTTCSTGGDITLPQTPTKYGYDFIGWEQVHFIRIEYLESTGTQYIDTGYLPNNNTHIKALFEITSVTNGSGGAFGGCTTDANDGYSFYNYNKTLYFNYMRQNQSSANNIKIGDMVYVDWNKNIVDFRVNSTAYHMELPQQIVSVPNTIYISNVHKTGGVTGTDMFKMYYFQIYENDQLLYDFIPVRRSDGVLGLYDTVTDTFFTNAGTGEFIAGPIISE